MVHGHLLTYSALCSEVTLAVHSNYKKKEKPCWNKQTIKTIHLYRCGRPFNNYGPQHRAQIFYLRMALHIRISEVFILQIKNRNTLNAEPDVKVELRSQHHRFHIKLRLANRRVSANSQQQPCVTNSVSDDRNTVTGSSSLFCLFVVYLTTPLVA